VTSEAVQIGLRGQPAVLGPLDLGGEIRCGPEPVWLRQGVADLAERNHLARQYPAGRVLGEMVKLPQGRRVKGSGSHSVDAEAVEPVTHLAGGLVRKGDRED
jgi:hypothetical protein